MTEPTEPNICVHLASTWHHSCDECSFPIFRCSFTSMYYLIINSNWRRKERGRPGNGARKTGAISMQITVGYAAECNTVLCYVCSTGPVPTVYVWYSLFFQATFEAAHLCCKLYRQLDQFHNLLLGNKLPNLFPTLGRCQIEIGYDIPTGIPSVPRNNSFLCMGQ